MDNKKQEAREKRVEKLTGQRYEMMQTKVHPLTFARMKRIAQKKGISEYTLIQMVIDTLVRYMDDRHNLTPELEQAMSIFEHMEGWRDSLNHADPTVQRVVGEAIYFLFDESGKKKGCRAVHVTKPFFGNWSEDLNVQHILERFLCLLFPERYIRLRQLAVEMQCSSMLELFDKLIDRHAKDSDIATFRELFEDADRSEWGRKPHAQPYRRHHHKDVDVMDGLDLFGEKDSDDETDFEDQIIKP